jgi:hypothetical protein
MMTSCLNATYHEAVNVAIASEEEYRKHKEAKKKKNVSVGSSGKCQKIIYHPKNHFVLPFVHHSSRLNNRHLFATLPYPKQLNAPGIRTLTQ